MLLAAGWRSEQGRGKGSHRIYWHPGYDNAVTLAWHVKQYPEIGGAEMSSENLKYTMVIEAEESGGEPYFNGYFPDVPGCTAYGRTLEEIRTNAASALSEHLATLRDHGKPVPEPHVRVESIAVSQ